MHPIFAVVALSASVALCVVPSASSAFALTSTAAPTFSIGLNGANQTANYTVPLTIDNSALGVSLTGWNATITSSQFSGGGRTLATSSSSMTAVAFSCASTCVTNPTNSITYPFNVPAGSGPPAAVKFFNAASYATTLTLTLAVGP